ncbi:MAG TPA: DOPA 4,5-dioxygenase family protein [Sphingomicrobium sp.]|nr:DOPA 4,5-dioxygenase family protein [Sphingomicrobium sp.]
MADDDAPFHGHIYYSAAERPAALALRDQFVRLSSAGKEPRILFVGKAMDKGVGPHPIAQFEVHFLKPALDETLAIIRASGLRALVHPLTDDDLADHTSLGQWIGEPLELDLTVLDPPGRNQGVARFGRSDF